MSRCQYCVNPGRKRRVGETVVWLCQRHWREFQKNPQVPS